MKSSLIILLFPLFSYAGSFEIIGPCSEVPLFEGDLPIVAGQNVGNLTIQALGANSIPYIGSEKGLQSIYETPTGMESLEILSKSEMRAYGWCIPLTVFRRKNIPMKY